MRIEEVKIFKFDELQESIQERIIEKYYEQEEYEYLSALLRESLEQKEDNIFTDDFKLFYSLSCCQGDGLCIQGDIDIKKIINLLSPELKTMFEDRSYRLYSTGNKGRYSYHSIQDIQYELDFYDNDNEEEIEELFNNEILPIVQNIYGKLCNELEKEGYSILEYRMSIAEFADFNNDNYLENGRRF
jgi:sulfatase maturation enzyme AslB (radical SAM superfamily)